MSCMNQLTGITVMITVNIILITCLATITRSSPTYRAAVVNFKPFPNTGSDRETIQKNVRQAVEYAEKAGRLGVDILAFPEYGLTTFDVGNWTRSSIQDGLEDVPDPKIVEWNPCLEPDRFPNQSNQVLRELSCAALNNSVAILANLLSREYCSLSMDPDCPPDGHYIYNTNVIFGKNGTFVARYHKYHLTGEDILNKPKQPEYTIVDLGFATFGTFICFDIYFEKPAVDLVNLYGVRNIIFSTASVNKLPFLTSPQLNAQFAHGLGVNLLVTNMYLPQRKRLGSGIYSSSIGALNESWDLAEPGVMIITDVPVHPEVPEIESTTCDEVVTATDGPLGLSEPASCDNPAFELANQTKTVLTSMPSSRMNENKTHRIYYESLSNYTISNLTGLQGESVLCQGTLCCKFEYEFQNRNYTDVYVMAVRNGCWMYGKHKIGLQVCAILRCENQSDVESCGRIPEFQPESRFKKIHISGMFQTTSVFPNIFSTTLSNVPGQVYEFKKQQCQDDDLSTRYKTNATIDTGSHLLEYPVMVASLYGRMYDWD